MDRYMTIGLITVIVMMISYALVGLRREKRLPKGGGASVTVGDTLAYPGHNETCFKRVVEKMRPSRSLGNNHLTQYCIITIGLTIGLRLLRNQLEYCLSVFHFWH